MGFYNIIIKYRFWLSLVAIFGGLGLELTGVAGFWPVFPLYFLGLIGILSHFFIGPLRLVQAPMEAGDMDEVERAFNILFDLGMIEITPDPECETYDPDFDSDIAAENDLELFHIKREAQVSFFEELVVLHKKKFRLRCQVFYYPVLLDAVLEQYICFANFVPARRR